MNALSKTGIFLLAILMFASAAAALDIEAPQRVPGFSPFTFRAALPATNMFTQALVQFDGINVATIYPTGACQISPDWIPFLLHCAAYDADLQTNDGLTAVITHTGFANGTHSITVSTQGPEAETKTVNVNVFEALDMGVKDQLDSDINELQNNVGTLQTQVTTNTQDVYGTQAAIETTKAETNQVIEDLSAKVSTLEAHDAQLAAEKEAAAKAGFQIPFLSGTGLAGGGNSPILGIAVLIVGALLAFFFVRGRSKGKGFGGDMRKSTPFFEGNMDSLFKGLPGSGSGDSSSSPQPHKFAAEEKALRRDVENDPPERDAKINFGDLIQKERD